MIPDANDLLIAGHELRPDGDLMDGDAPPGDLTLPTITVTTKEAEVNDQAIQALATIPNVYSRGNALVRVLQQRKHNDGAPLIGILPKATLQEHLATSARFVKMKEEKGGEWIEVDQHPPRWCVEAVEARGTWPTLRHLTGVVETAVLRPDGTVLSEHGYDPKTELLFVGTGKVKPVPDRPTLDDVSGALDQLADVVVDFPFAALSHRSCWLAAVLTLLARPAFSGPAPLFLFDATVAGTGKSLLCDVTTIIGTGRQAVFNPYTANDDEMAKLIVTWGASGRRVVVLDDIGTTPLDGSALRSTITSPTIGGRVLSMSREWTGPNTITWMATGNNVRIGPEMHRRVAPATLVANVEDPARRSQFKHRDLVAWVLDHQPELAAAGLTILRGYITAGRPPQKIRGWGSFDGWNALVRSAIVWAGWPDPVIANEAMQAEQDTKTAAYRALVEGWSKLEKRANAGRSLTAKEAVAFVCQDPPPLPDLRDVLEAIACDKSGKVSAKALGYVLKTISRRVFVTSSGNLYLMKDGEDRTGTARWRAGKAGDAGEVAPNTHARETPLSPARVMVGISPALPSLPARDPFSPEEERGSGMTERLEDNDDPF